MKPKNRIAHSYSRWPSNPARRLELAQLDIEFCAALVKIEGGITPEIDRLARRAFDVGAKASRHRN